MLFLEDFLEILEQVPGELRDRFTELRELDLQVQNAHDRNDELIRALFRSAPASNPESLSSEYARIRSGFDKMLEDSDEKVAIATKLQELVQRFLFKLDSELKQFKLELEADSPGITESLERKVYQVEEAKNRQNRDTSSGPSARKRRKVAIAAVGETVNVDGRPAKVKDEPSSSSGGRSRMSPSESALWDAILLQQQISSGCVPSGSGSSRSSGRMTELSHKQMLAAVEQLASTSAGTSGDHRYLSGVDSSKASSAFLQAFKTPEARSGSGSGRNRKLTSKVGEMLKESMQRRQVTDGSAAPCGVGSEAVKIGGAHSHGDGEGGGRVIIPDEFELKDEDSSDPNEPRYCICNQVSYGEMVACDNKDCPFEWFHYACVGITQPPKGKWYCPQCTAAMRRRASRLGYAKDMLE